jgi:ornithine decarboxylase
MFTSLGKARQGQNLKLLHDLALIARYDHSVSVPELGSVFRYEPNTSLGQALQSVAAAYNAPAAFISTNGTTTLNALAMHSQIYPGDEVLIQRDSHVSAYAAVTQLPIQPHYVTPRFCERRGVPLGITSEQLEFALAAHPAIKLAFVTYPNYFGIATDIADLATVCHQHGVRLIVDEAHGSHLNFHPTLPTPAERVGAQIVTQSTHKTASALGQGSLALILDEAILPRWYQVVNTHGYVSTSFSYVLLASVLAAVWQMESQGEALLGQAIEASNWLRDEINRIDGLRCFGFEGPEPGFVAFDPLRVTVDVSGIGLTGFEAEEALIAEDRHYPEMATLQNTLFLLTLADTRATAQTIAQRLRRLAESHRGSLRRPTVKTMPQPTRQLMRPHEVFYSRKQRSVPASVAFGNPSAETISAYPPGSAVIVAGEEVTVDIIDYLREVRACGGVLKGATDPDLQSITIVVS